MPLSNGSGEFLLFEFPLAFWLEKEGYDVTYISNIDTHADGKGLLRAKGFLSVGHDEYWTQEMYDNVARARDEGVSLAFLSGNSVSGIVYLNPSTDGRPNRVFGRVRRFPNDNDVATVYDGPKGNIVFNAGTCWWNMVLSSPPGFANPPKKDFSQDDQRVQQITRNVLSRMMKGER